MHKIKASGLSILAKIRFWKSRGKEFLEMENKRSEVNIEIVFCQVRMVFLRNREF